MDTIRQMTARIEPGYARRWIRRNWAKALYAAGWAALAIGIRESVAAMRPEHWHMGSEIFPAIFCWVMAARCALGEKPARKRPHRKTEQEGAAGRDVSATGDCIHRPKREARGRAASFSGWRPKT